MQKNSFRQKRRHPGHEQGTLKFLAGVWGRGRGVSLPTRPQVGNPWEAEIGANSFVPGVDVP